MVGERSEVKSEEKGGVGSWQDGHVDGQFTGGIFL
jgi:hypothetical protein